MQLVQRVAEYDVGVCLSEPVPGLLVPDLPAPVVLPRDRPVLPVPHAYIFGAGHISKSLSKVATLAGFATVVIDNRDTFANRERFPEAAEVHALEYEDVFPQLAINENSYLIIVTRGHRPGRSGKTPCRSVPGKMPNRPGLGYTAIPASGADLRDGVASRMTVGPPALLR